MRRYPIEIAEYNSALIRAEAIAAGITHMREIDRVRSRGVLYRLLALPHCGGEIRVLDTNGDPIWEEQNLAAFAEQLAEIGIAVTE